LKENNFRTTYVQIGEQYGTWS